MWSSRSSRSACGPLACGSTSRLAATSRTVHGPPRSALTLCSLCARSVGSLSSHAVGSLCAHGPCGRLGRSALALCSLREDGSASFAGSIWDVHEVPADPERPDVHDVPAVQEDVNGWAGAAVVDVPAVHEHPDSVAGADTVRADTVRAYTMRPDVPDVPVIAVNPTIFEAGLHMLWPQVCGNLAQSVLARASTCLASASAPTHVR